MPESRQARIVRAACAGLILALSTPVISVAQSKPAELAQWRSGLSEIDEGWAEHDGDNPRWSQPDFDDSSWSQVDLDELGPARTGWRWYRKRVRVGPDFPNVRLMLEGGTGTYEIYVNGGRLPGANLNSEFNVHRPVERVFTLQNDDGDYSIALRTHPPANYANYKLPLFLSVTLGRPTAIGYERAALQADRLNSLWPSLAINLLLCIAAIGVLCLYLGQRTHRDYLFLGLYLFVLGLSNGLWNLQLAGVAPTSLNFLGSDLLVYVFTILQIEFTFSFAGKRPGRTIRVYQAALLLPWILAGFCWVGRFPEDTYALIEAAITIPAAFLLTSLLLIWYRRGNREAGWLIIPSLLPLSAAAFFDLGYASMVLGWGRFDFLDSPIPVGPLQFQLADLANLLFLIAIAIVMFFRFTRISREQAHSAAELEAARAVQLRLVPPAGNVPGFHIESAYLPAAHVGGDFYHIRRYDDGSLLAVVGDVSGKGLPAAIAVSAIVGALQAMPDLEPARVLGALNRGVYTNANGGFVTCCAAVISADGKAAIANAGHLPPYLCSSRSAEPGARAIELPVEFGLPLGIIPDAEYSETALELAPGDTLTLLTDGVVEARNSAGELFGFDRTAAISTESAQTIARAASTFGQEDDITVLTLTRTPA